MNDDRREQTILVTQLDDRARQLVRDVGKGKLRVIVTEADGERIAEVRRIDRHAAVDIWSDYDPEAARAVWRKSAGVLRGVDVAALLTDIKAEREQDSPGRPA